MKEEKLMAKLNVLGFCFSFKKTISYHNGILVELWSVFIQNERNFGSKYGSTLYL